MVIVSYPLVVVFIQYNPPDLCGENSESGGGHGDGRIGSSLPTTPTMDVSSTNSSPSCPRRTEDGELRAEAPVRSVSPPLLVLVSGRGGDS